MLLWRFNVAGNNKTYLNFHTKSLIFLANFNHLDFDGISTEDPNIKFHEIPSSGRCADKCTQMARQTDMTKVMGSFCNYAVNLKLHFVQSIFIHFVLFLQSKAVTELSSINQLIFVMKKKGTFCDVGTGGC
jgi:hypothetical protein